MRISFCGTIKKSENVDKTLISIRNQSVKVNEIIITKIGNISQGRNEYLKQATGDIIFTFDSGCIYEKDYVKKMLEGFEKDTDIVMGIVLPQKPKNLIQEFCATRMPQYFRFTEEDWNKFIPSNRQVAFKRQVINKLGLLPIWLDRADDTYWFSLARKRGLKFNHTQALCYWETKKTLKEYLRTIYLDDKSNKEWGIERAVMPNKINPLLFPYGCFVGLCLFIVKIWEKIVE
jgi:glycosyltransferase involved in cell wall biosynthesis